MKVHKAMLCSTNVKIMSRIIMKIINHNHRHSSLGRIRFLRGVTRKNAGISFLLLLFCNILYEENTDMLKSDRIKITKYISVEHKLT